MLLFPNLSTKIESKILEFLADDKDALYSTIRVSQAWHKQTVDLLWQHLSANKLSMFEEPRRQHYANKVTKLEVTNRDCYSEFRTLSFPALVEVTLNAHYLPDLRPRPGEVRIRPYLQPTLRKLHLTELFILTEDALDLICLCCPLLEDLRLSAQLAVNDPYGNLIHTTFVFPRLLRLVFELNNIISHSAMRRLSEQLPSLEYLELGPQYFDLREEFVGAVFSRLRTLKLYWTPHLTHPDLYGISMTQFCL